MENPIAIDRLCAQLGLTSRTLRHWESQELFASRRDESSGWRTYDGSAVLAIRITMLLRGLGLPIRAVKEVLSGMTCKAMADEIVRYMQSLDGQAEELCAQRERLRQVLTLLKKEIGTGGSISEPTLSRLKEAQKDARADFEKEVTGLKLEAKGAGMPQVRFVTLPPMRMACFAAVSVSPEEEALAPVVKWVDLVGLTGVSRIFGSNMPPMPSGDGKPYGYGVCASVPQEAELPPHLEERTFEGGLYACVECNEYGDNIYGAWQALMNCLDCCPEYEADHGGRRCLEEHIRNDSGEGGPNRYYLNLMEPVKRR